MPMALALIGVAALAWPGADQDVTRELASRDEAQRLRAVLELARADAPRARALLVPALHDRDPNVRVTAGRLLARRGAPEAALAATAWLADPAPRERLLGLLVLKEAAELPSEARHAVERALRNGDVMTRLQGLDLLATHPAASSFAAVIAALDDELAEIRVRALRALAAMGDGRASLPVARRLADADRGVRVEAATTLGALGDRRVVPALLRQLDETTPDPRTPAVDALGRLGDPAAVPALAKLALRSPRDELARHAAIALGALGTPEALEALLARAREPPGGEEVSLGLERAGTRAVPRLCREVSSGSPTSARLVMEALGRMGDRRATAALVAAIEKSTGPSPAALEALVRLADPAAVPALVRVATEAAAPELRVLALGALKATGDDRALVALPRALADSDPTVRARAAGLAGALGGPAQAAPLVARLGDTDGEVRLEAARALARLASLPTEATRAIAEALSRAAATSRDAAAFEALGDALERAVHGADGPALARAYLAALSKEARGALARALAAASAEAPLADEAVIDMLLRDVAEGGELALSAAEALGRARLPRAAETKVVVVYARAEDAVRARLAPALASFAPGVTALERALADATVAPSVRAAAAWALGGEETARGALKGATASREPAVAANARAALAVPTRAGPRWSAVRLTSADGEIWPGRWVTVTAAEGTPIWVLTDLRGRARIAGLPEGPLALRLPPE
jgi:HEAT repeat protein